MKKILVLILSLTALLMLSGCGSGSVQSKDATAESTEADTLAFTDRHTIAPGGRHTIALKKDGKVVAVGYDGGYGNMDVDGWTGIAIL